MQLNWTISDEDVGKWHCFVNQNINNTFVQNRQIQNVDRESIDTSKQNLWFIHVGCQVTSVQRSDPDSAVSRFLNSDSPALNYSECVKSSDLEVMLFTELSKARLRRTNTIANNLAGAFIDL